MSGLGRRASGEEEDEQLSRNAGGRRTEKALPFLVSERGLSSDTGGFILTTVPSPTLSLSRVPFGLFLEDAKTHFTLNIGIK